MSHSVSRRYLLKGAAVAAPLAVAPVPLFGGTQSSAPEAYIWRNVRIGGGGYVTGMVIHPRERDLIYVRTDVGGIYRWNSELGDTADQWVPVTDGFPVEQWNYYGVESIALDPSNSDLVYAALGKYPWAGKGRIFRSGDRGVTWEPLGLEVAMHGNGPSRNGGERLAVHPHDPGTIFFGSRYDGLWRSVDGGAFWSQQLQADGADKGPGVIFVHVVARAAGEAIIYAGVVGKGIYRSDDSGESWVPIGGPEIPKRAATARDSVLIVTASTGVHRHEDGKWTDITPDAQHKYCGVSVDPGNADIIVAAASEPEHLRPIFISQDGGKSWTEYAKQNGRAVPRSAAPWWPSRAFASAIAAVVVDPHVAGRLWFTDWHGVWRTDDSLRNEQVWSSPIRGIENTVIMTLSTPPTGAFLLSGCYDVDGFVHRDLDAFPENKLLGLPIWNTLGIDHHEADPRRLVRVGLGGKRKIAPTGGVGVSEDGGETWRPIPWPFGPVSKVAYSATDPAVIVALPLGDDPKTTNDLGASWHGSAAIVRKPPIEKEYQWAHPLAADRVDGRAFYLFAAGEFLRTLDAGRTWSVTARLPESAAPMVEAAPGLEGVVWVGLEGHGLYASRDKGVTFAKIDGVETARLFSFGRAAPGSEAPSVFLYGRLKGDTSEAIYRSDDQGLHWIRISAPEQPVGCQPAILRGDRQVFGRAYIGTRGRGVFVGEIAVPRP